jgi:antitoxin component of RelBE/YafQ-DinJ toxin-antitoxin module
MKKEVAVMTYLDEADAELLKSIAQSYGIPLSAAVRMCVRYVLHEVLAAQPFAFVVRKAEKPTKGGIDDEGTR